MTTSMATVLLLASTASAPLCAEDTSAQAAGPMHYESPSVTIDGTATAVHLSRYTQNRKWNDQHQLILAWASILSVNGFDDEAEPKISITSREMILDNTGSENRIYWVALKDKAEVDAVVALLWRGMGRVEK
jgi:hypothetical protein